MAYPLKWVEIVYPLPAAGSLAMLQAVCQVASIKREGGMLEPAKYQSSRWEGISPEAAQALIPSTVVVVRRPRVGKGLRESSLSVSKAPHPINALPVVL